MEVIKDAYRRKLHKGVLRYHDAENWPLLREALVKMGRADLIGHGPQQLIPPKAAPRALARPNRSARRTANRWANARLLQESRSHGRQQRRKNRPPLNRSGARQRVCRFG